MAEYVAVPAVNAVPVGDLDLKVAALIEPMTVALHGIRRVPFEEGQDAAVLGGGVIGLMTVIALRALGARSVTVVDVNPWNLEMARRSGATHTVNALEQDVAAHFDGVGRPALVVETAGAAATRAQALAVAGKNGAVVYVGTPTTDLTLDPETFEHILRKELTIRGSWMSYSAPFPGDEWTTAARLLAGAASDPADIVSHVFGLGEVADGFAVMRAPSARRLKVMFRVHGDQR
jgi:L-iditol 2-dehydrogenase/galactitol-1-phosphate 5-dehydrogenase